MAGHQIPTHLVDPLTAGPSAAMVTRVSDLQNFIQDLFGENYHTFLQGSYRNHTAINDINDVDIVVVRKRTYSTVHCGRRFDSSISWDTIFGEIEAILGGQSRYQWRMERGDKCIKLDGSINVDVVPAVQIMDDHLEDPIAIYSFRNGEEKISHPRVHIDNGQDKHSRTDEQFKPTVRMFKNWKKNHFGDDDIVSSHQIEALVHHVNDGDFYLDPVHNFLLPGYSIIERLDELSPTIPSVCGNEDVGANWDLHQRNRLLSQLRSSVDRAHRALKSGSETEAARLWREAFNL